MVQIRNTEKNDNFIHLKILKCLVWSISNKNKNFWMLKRINNGCKKSGLFACLKMFIMQISEKYLLFPNKTTMHKYRKWPFPEGIGRLMLPSPSLEGGLRGAGRGSELRHEGGGRSGGHRPERRPEPEGRSSLPRPVTKQPDWKTRARDQLSDQCPREKAIFYLSPTLARLL